MAVKIYARLDPATDPERGEPSFRRRRTLIRDVRPPTLNRYDHYAQVARAATLTGLDGLVIAHRPDADDSQIIAGAVARSAPNLLLVPEFPASVGSAVYAAKQAVSFQRATHNRLGWTIVRDANADERLRSADVIDDGDLSARVEEFLTVARGVHSGPGYTLKGKFFEVLNGGFDEPLNRVPFPRVFLSGDDEDSIELSARVADVHWFGPADPDQLRDRIETLDRLALQQDRSVEFGITASVIARETEEDLEGLTGADLIGTYAQVATRLAELAAVGATHFQLSAEPAFEEVYRLGQFVAPRLRSLTTTLRAAA